MLVFATILFNPLLAYANGRFLSVSSLHVAACEVLIVAAAHVWILLNWRGQMIRWYALIAIFVGIALIRAVATGDPNPKFFRDVLLIPTFILLGLTVQPGRALDRLVVAVALVIVTVMLWEAYDVDSYANTFRVADFYAATRGIEAIEFEERDLQLWFSAERYAGRFLDFVDWHRLSSVFLEPLSLGNVCLVFTAYLFARWPRLPAVLRVVLLVSIFLIIVGSDGRRATLVLLLMTMCVILSPLLPARLPILYLPFVVAAAFVLVWSFGLEPGEDNFSGRIAYGVDLFGQLGPLDWLGLSDRFVDATVDAGLIYLIVTQSIFGSILLWLAIVLGSEVRTGAQVRYLQAAAIYLATEMVVSNAFLTIKTAGLLWFLFGALQRGDEATETAVETHDLRQAVSRRAGRGAPRGTVGSIGPGAE